MNRLYFSVAACGILVFLVYSLFFDPLRKIPGPFLARWSRAWIIYHSLKGDMHTKMIALHKQYGKLVRIAPNEVSVADPAALKVIYGAGTKFRKSDWYSVWQGRRTFDLFAERDVKVHGTQRRLVSSIYSMSSLRKLETNVDAALEVMLARLAQVSSKPINIGYWAQLFAFDVVGTVTFSKPFGLLESGDDSGLFSALDTTLRSGAWVGQVPWLFWLHDRLSPYTGYWLNVGKRNSSFKILTSNTINSTVESEKNKNTTERHILGQLEEVHKTKPNEMTSSAVTDMASSNIFAGSDTTAISITAVLYHLCRNPDAMQRLKREVNSTACRVGEDGIWPFDVAVDMPYLQACIWEGLRLHPAVGMNLPRVTPEGGIEIQGNYFPKGIILGTNAWVIHRNQEVFGKDADQFRPERWLSENRGQLERFFFAFGAGARTCIGRNLSWIEISKLVPSLLHRWDLDLANPDAAGRNVCRWFVKQEELYMALRPRSTNLGV